ncbi:CLUMA_CG013175, isoform A [Clunio marinus]|uniref:CLUMA_CG013175, isoform A n=1 Tax=Clunio marinus TaxID=568069 RepID=A0A1J1II50_9DIPT|nr:CLUMA_CG013175, isoform A [Clunio marinus]
MNDKNRNRFLAFPKAECPTSEMISVFSSIEIQSTIVSRGFLSQTKAWEKNKKRKRGWVVNNSNVCDNLYWIFDVNSQKDHKLVGLKTDYRTHYIC